MDIGIELFGASKRKHLLEEEQVFSAGQGKVRIGAALGTALLKPAHHVTHALLD